jgi:hypothetical protein
MLALLVVLTLFTAVFSLPAGSATLQQPSDTGGVVSMSPNGKEGDGGEDIDGGDDDRWGNTEPDGNGGATGGDATDDEEDEFGGNARVLGGFDVLRIELRALFGFLVILL